MELEFKYHNVDDQPLNRIDASVHEAIARITYGPEAHGEVISIAQNDDDGAEEARQRNAILADLLQGDSWSDASIKWFKNQFEKAAKEPNANANTIFQYFHNIRMDINSHSKGAKIGIARSRDHQGTTHFYVALSKDADWEEINESAALARHETRTVKQIGTISPSF